MNKPQRQFRLSRLHAGMLLALGAGIFNTATAQEEALEEIQVTGSRISRSTMDTPTPVTTMQAAELSAMAPGNLIDGLAQMPQFYGNVTPDAVNGGQNSGGSNINLRGAGTNRTLTLLNGRRVVPSNRFGTVDVAVFPEDLLRSVETVTGGASASYGTDAVAGVVNFLLDTDYVGVKTHTQGGRNEIGDGHNWEAGVAFGYEFDNGIHVLGSLSAYDMAPIRSFSSLQDRDYLKRTARITNPDATGPTEIIRDFVRPTNFSNTGVLVDTTRPALNRLEFQQDGSLAPLGFNGMGALNTGCLCYSDPANGYGVNSDPDLNSGYERENLFLYTDWDITDSTSIFAQLIGAQNEASDRREGISQLSGWQGHLYPDNAFLQPEVSQLLLANGVTNTPGYTQTGTIRPLGGIGYGFFGLNVADSPVGESVQDTTNKLWSFTTGFTHDFSGGVLDGWTMDGYYQYGENEQDFITLNGVRVDRFQMAMDAVRHPTTGQPICRVNHPDFTGSIASGGNGGLFSDCVPVNTFGGVQNISQAGADYIMDRDNKVARQWTEQDVFELVLNNGELFQGFGAGPIGAAVGASYREERFEQRTLNASDEYPAQVNGTLLSDQGLMSPTLRGVVPAGHPSGPGIAGLRFVPAGYLGDANSSSVLFSSLRANEGSYNVKEAFVEFNVPLLSDMPFIDYLETSVAARWADYEGSGDIWAWKMGLNWTVTEEVRVRATNSRDVRAGSLRDRFDQTRGGINVRNPWDNNNVVSAASLSGGNPNVQPEEADTWTAGVVYRPNWLDGFSASLDWYKIDIADALAQLTAQNIVDSCRNGDVTLCQYVITPTGPVTDPTTNNFRQIDRVESIFINLANQRLSGMDMELSYSTDINLFGNNSEAVAFRFLTSWLEENSVQNPGGIVDDRAGQIGAFGFPEYKITSSVTYTNGPYSGFLQARWIDGGTIDRTFLESNSAVPASARPAGSNLVLCNNGATICTIDDNSVPSTIYFDARIGGNFGENENLEVYMNINNLLDRDPELTPGTVGRTGIGLGVNGLYDMLGRRYTVGVNYEF